MLSPVPGHFYVESIVDLSYSWSGLVVAADKFTVERDQLCGDFGGVPERLRGTQVPVENLGIQLHSLKVGPDWVGYRGGFMALLGQGSDLGERR